MSHLVATYPAKDGVPEIEYRFDGTSLQQVIDGTVVQSIVARPIFLLEQARAWHREHLGYRAELSHFGTPPSTPTVAE